MDCPNCELGTLTEKGAVYCCHDCSMAFDKQLISIIQTLRAELAKKEAELKLAYYQLEGECEKDCPSCTHYKTNYEVIEKHNADLMNEIVTINVRLSDSNKICDGYAAKVKELEEDNLNQQVAMDWLQERHDEQKQQAGELEAENKRLREALEEIKTLWENMDKSERGYIHFKSLVEEVSTDALKEE